MSGIGRVCIGTGVLLLLFVAYQLWGTGIATARDQRSLERAFDARLAEMGITLGDPESGLPGPVTSEPVTSDPGVAPTSSPTTAPSTVPFDTGPTDTAAPTSAPATSAPATSAPAGAGTPTTRAPAVETTSRDRRTRRLEARPGDLVARIRIPTIGVDDIVVAGVKKTDLKKGPGHYPGTPLPGAPGNAAIAGHRTTYGAPFFRLNDLRPGDPIFVATVTTGQWFRYEVSDTRIVRPQDNFVLLAKKGRNTLTLTTCHPRYSAAQRLIITADLVGTAVEQDWCTSRTAAPTTPGPTVSTPIRAR